MRWKVNMRRNQILGCTPVSKRDQKKLSVTTPDSQLLTMSTTKATEKKLNNLQKQQIYKIPNSESAWTHPIQETIAICCYS